MLHVSTETARAEIAYRTERISRDYRSAAKWWSLHRERPAESAPAARPEWRLAA